MSWKFDILRNDSTYILYMEATNHELGNYIDILVKFVIRDHIIIKY